MVKYEEFEEFYSNININKNELEQNWKEIKEKKKKIMKPLLISFGIIDIIIVIIMIAFLGVFAIFGMFQILVIELVVSMILYAVVGYKEASKFNVDYKEKLIKKLLENFIENLEYSPTTGLDREIFNEAQYRGYYNRYRSDDYFEGKMSNNKIIMADLVVENETTTTDSDGNTTTDTTTIFNGLFGKIELNKSIETKLTLSMGFGPAFLRKDKVEMDSSEFEKKFNVYSDNKIIAMQLLTADIQQDILEIYNKYKTGFYIYIDNKNMYTLFQTGHMFEVSYSKNNPEEQLKKYFEIMKFVDKLINKIIKTIEETEI